MEKDWVMIFNTNNLQLSEIAKSVLENNDIEAISMNKMDSAYLFGEIEIYIKREHVVRAKHLLKNLSS